MPSDRTLKFLAQASRHRRRANPFRELPFVMGVLADLSGQNRDTLPDLADRKFEQIDAETFDIHLKACAPRISIAIPITLTGGGNFKVDLTFESIEDFTPIGIARKHDALRHILKAREDLAALLDGNTLAAPQIIPPGIPKELLTPLQTAIQRAKTNCTLGTQQTERIEKAIRTFFQHPLPHGLDYPTAIRGFILTLDENLSRQINLILHHPDFQTLEGTWRGLHYLVHNTETHHLLKVRILNVTKREILKMVNRYAEACWDQSPLFKKIYTEEFDTLGGEPFGCILGDYQFDHSTQDIRALGGLAQICTAAYCPFIAAAAPSLMGMDTWHELNRHHDISKIFRGPEYAAWRALRDTEDSRFICLTIPRVLARPPYSATSETTGEFTFEEQIGADEPRTYCWMNAAYALGVNINRALQSDGRIASISGPKNGGLVEGLPVRTIQTEAGAPLMTGPAETYLWDRSPLELEYQGITPLCYSMALGATYFCIPGSLQRPEIYDSDGVTANARLASRLPYIFATSRVTHLLKLANRKSVGTLKDHQAIEAHLNEFLAKLTTLNPYADATEKAERPLSYSELCVAEETDSEGYHHAKLYLRFHPPLDGLTGSICTTLRLRC